MYFCVSVHVKLWPIEVGNSKTFTAETLKISYADIFARKMLISCFVGPVWQVLINVCYVYVLLLVVSLQMCTRWCKARLRPGVQWDDRTNGWFTVTWESWRAAPQLRFRKTQQQTLSSRSTSLCWLCFFHPCVSQSLLGCGLERDHLWFS